MDCGIGVDQTPATPGQQVSSDLPVVNQHRVLLFCQLKGMLDIVEKDLFKYVRLNREISIKYGKSLTSTCTCMPDYIGKQGNAYSPKGT